MSEEGFVVSDKNRRAVFTELAAGPSSLDRIVKRLRLIRPAAERAARDLTAQGLVEPGDGGSLRLTARGEEVAVDLKKQDLLS